MKRAHSGESALWYYNSTGFGKVKSDLSDGADRKDGADGRGLDERQ